MISSVGLTLNLQWVFLRTYRIHSQSKFLCCVQFLLHGKKGFVSATKLGTTNNFLLLQPKISLQQPNVLLTELNILLLSQNVFVIPILTNDFVSITKPFLPCINTLWDNILVVRVTLWISPRLHHLLNAGIGTVGLWPGNFDFSKIQTKQRCAV